MIEHTMGSIYCPPTPVLFVNFRPNLDHFIVNNCRIPSELGVTPLPVSMTALLMVTAHRSEIFKIKMHFASIVMHIEFVSFYSIRLYISVIQFCKIWMQ